MKPNNKYTFFFFAVLASILLTPDAFASVNFSATTTDSWEFIERARNTGFSVMVTNFLGANSFLLAFAKSIFIGFSIIGLVWYWLLFADGGSTRLLEDKGIFLFLIYVLVVFNLLYNSALNGVFTESLGGNTPSIGVLGFDIYLMSDKAGTQILASALGVADNRSPLNALFNTPSLLSIHHQGSWWDSSRKSNCGVDTYTFISHFTFYNMASYDHVFIDFRLVNYIANIDVAFSTFTNNKGLVFWFG